MSLSTAPRRCATLNWLILAQTTSRRPFQLSSVLFKLPGHSHAVSALHRLSALSLGNSRNSHGPSAGCSLPEIAKAAGPLCCCHKSPGQPRVCRHDDCEVMPNAPCRYMYSQVPRFSTHLAVLLPERYGNMRNQAVTSHCLAHQKLAR